MTSTQRRVVLGGIGGVGKTQLAVAYTHQHERSYTSALWLNASSELSLSASLRSVSQGLIVARELETLDSKQVLARVHEWLAHAENTQWLLIFDNYDDPDDFDLRDFCPDVGHGSVMITTRRPDRVKVSGVAVRVQPLTVIEDSLAILQIRSGRQNVRDGGHNCTYSSTQLTKVHVTDVV